MEQTPCKLNTLFDSQEIPRTTMEPEDSLSRPLETATYPCREPHESIPVPDQVNTLPLIPVVSHMCPVPEPSQYTPHLSSPFL